MVRQVQLVEDAYQRDYRDTEEKSKGHFGIREKAALFAWMHRGLGDHAMYPDLQYFVSREVEEDASSRKQTREVREEQFLARRSEKGDT